MYGQSIMCTAIPTFECTQHLQIDKEGRDHIVKKQDQYNSQYKDKIKDKGKTKRKTKTKTMTMTMTMTTTKTKTMTTTTTKTPAKHRGQPARGQRHLRKAKLWNAEDTKQDNTPQDRIRQRNARQDTT
jgi:hypothetical protein